MRKVVIHEYNRKWIKLLLSAEHSKKNWRKLCSLSAPCYVVSLVGNTFIGIVLYKTQTLRKPINYFIANMAMSDLLYPVFVIPW